MNSIPTLSDIYNSIISSIETKFSVTLPTIGKNFLQGMAGVQAGKLWLLYKTVAFTQKNIYVDTADSELIGGTLERFGRVKLGRNPFPAIAGIYKVTVTGEIGAVIPASTTFISDDNSENSGFLFVLDTEHIFTSTSDIIPLRALTAGLDSALEIGNTLSATSPIALVDDTATVAGFNVFPQAAEDLEEYRKKIIQSDRIEAQGGAGADYRLWSYDAQGVKQSYPFVVIGNVNEINFYIEATIVDSQDGRGTPTTTILNAVKNAIELPTATRPSRKPLTVHKVHYLPITPRKIDIVVNGYVGITQEKKIAIETAIVEYLTRVRPFVGSIDVLAEKNDILDINNIISIILQTIPGSTFGTITMGVDAVILTNFQFLGGDIPFLNSIHFL